MITPITVDTTADVRDIVIGRLTVQLEQEREFAGKLSKELRDLRESLRTLASQGEAYRDLTGFCR